MQNVTTTTIVNEMQTLIDDVKSDKKLDIEKKVKLITSLTDRQLRAGVLNLGYQRAIARLPEGAAALVPQLNALAEPAAGATKQ